MTYDPDHEHDEPDLPLADNPIWQQDNVTLHSVGIDIGLLPGFYPALASGGSSASSCA